MAHSLSEKIAFIEKAFGRGLLAKNQKNINVRCPVPSCGSRKDRSKKKLAIRVDDDLNHCWVCGWAARSLAPLLIKYGDESLLHEYRSRFSIRGPNTFEDGIEGAQRKLELPEGYQFLITAQKSDPDVLAVWNYLFKRGLGEPHVWRFKIGVSLSQRWKSRAIVLSHDDSGELNFYSGRAINNKLRPKYDGPDNIKTTEIIFNQLNIDWSQRLTLCEGPFDLMKCNDNATCLLGSNLSEQSLLFNQIVLHGTPVAIALDDDMKEKSLLYARKLSEYNVDVSLVDLGDRHDPGEMSRQEFVERLSAARPFSWHDSFMSKLQAI